MSVEARTWTLEQAVYGTQLVFELEGGESLDIGAQVEVIEANPVLDLLERLMPAYEREAWSPTDFEVEAFLRTQGRLGA